MRRTLKGFLLGTWIFLFGCSLVSAQSGTAEISGAVSDSSGAVLPGVEVSAIQTTTGASRTAITNETGVFVLTNLPVGPYQLEAVLPGFRKFVRSGIILQINSSAVVNISLEIGDITQTIEVQANAAMVETRATGVGEVIDNQRILELPLVGRQVTDLVVLAGAAVQTAVAGNNSRSFPTVARFSLAGGLDRGTAFTLDGASHNEVRSNVGYPMPFPDALQEFKVETSAVPAQYGFRSGGAINAVTKSGTNEFHGNLFEFVRNGKFNARNFFAATTDPLKRNQFGGTVGGPIKRNKVFFFTGYQGTATRQAPSSTVSFVPTPAMMNGDFSKFASTACRPTALSLPSPFVNNVLPQDRINPASLALAKRLPAAEDECGTTRWGNPVRRMEHMYVGKVDYQVSSNHSVFWRYLGYTFDQDPPTKLVDNALATGVGGLDNQFHSGTFGDTMTIGPDKVNTFRLGWNRERIQWVNPQFFDVTDLGIKAYHQVPKMIVVTVSQAFNVGSRTANPNSYNETGYQISDDFGLLHGNHQINFGGNWMAFQVNNNSLSGPTGTWTFSGDSTGNAMADFMLGRMTSLRQAGANFNYVRTKAFALYAQDSWRVRSGLTLSLGLRWEPYLAQRFERDVSNYFDINAFLRGEKTAQFVNAPPGIFYPGDSQFPEGGNRTNPIKNHWQQWAPRLGFTWDPWGSGRTVVRAAYGIFYETQNSEFNLAMGQGAPWGGAIIVQNVPFDDPYRDFPGGNPFPFVPNKNAPYLSNGVFGTTFPETTPPYVQQWNLGIQRQIGTNWMVSASYLGNAVTHLYGAVELNPGNFIPGNADAGGNCFATVEGRSVALRLAPGAACSTTGNIQQRRTLSLLDPTGALESAKYSNINAWDDNGTRSYHGMLLSLTKRMSANFSATANYTYGHCISTPANVMLNPGAAGVLSDPTNRRYDRGNCTASGSDIRHLVNATAVVNTPSFSNTWVQRLVGDWSISGILRARSGNPLAPSFSTDRLLTGVNAGAQRPDVTSSNVYGNQCKSDLLASNPTCRWLNTDAFAMPASGRLGNMGGGTVFGPSAWTVDAGLSRTFRITERHQLEFRGEATNVLNHTNLGDPTTALGATFGRISSAADPRIMQFSMKYLF